MIGISQGQIAPVTTAIFTNPLNSKGKIKSIFLHNSGNSGETIGIYFVPNNTGAVGIADDSNLFFSEILAPNESYELNFSFPVILGDENDTIQAVTDTENTVNFVLLGVQST